MERRGVELVGWVEPLQEEQIQVQEAKVQQIQACVDGFIMVLVRNLDIIYVSENVITGHHGRLLGDRSNLFIKLKI